MVDEASIYIIVVSVAVLGLALFTVAKTKQIKDKVEFLLYEIDERGIQVGSVAGDIYFATGIVMNYLLSKITVYIAVAICLVSPWIYYTRLHSFYSIVVGLLLILFPKSSLGSWKAEYHHLVRLYYASVARELKLGGGDSPFDLVDHKYIDGGRYEIEKLIYKESFLMRAFIYGIAALAIIALWVNIMNMGQE